MWVVGLIRLRLVVLHVHAPLDPIAPFWVLRCLDCLPIDDVRLHKHPTALSSLFVGLRIRQESG